MRHLTLIFVPLLCLMLALGMTVSSLSNLPFNEYHRATFSQSIAGTAFRPYALRALLPALMRLELRFISSTSRDKIIAWSQQQPILKNIAARQGLVPAEFPELWAFAMLSASCFFGYYLCLFGLLQHFYSEQIKLWWLWLPFSYAVTNAFLGNYFYVYDPGTLLGSAACLLLLARKQWPLFFVAFILSTFNKESSLLFVPLAMISRRDHLHSPYHLHWRLGAALFIIWAAIVGFLRWNFRFNRGTGIEFHLFDQWTHYADMANVSYFILLVSLFSVAIISDWKNKPLLLRQHLCLTIPAIALLMLFFGLVFETRDYLEAVPSIFLLSLFSLVALANKALLPFLRAR